MTDGAKKFDSGKNRYDLIPVDAIEGIAEALTMGAAKYGDNNWRGIDPERYYAALFRHLIAWRKGEIDDPESGLNHLKHVLVNTVFLLELTKNKE
tara:strand:- start:747 stop:1031 length:285 start_codon:yes stop_codon:yes gene_type:complete